MVYYFVFESGNSTEKGESLVEKDGVWTSTPAWTMAVNRCLRSSVSLRRLRQGKENICVDNLDCVGPSRG